MTWALFLAAHLAPVAFGAPAAFHPRLRRAPVVVRVAAAFAAGVVALTVLATVWSLVGVGWTVATLAVPLLVGAVPVCLLWAQRDVEFTAPGRGSTAVVVAGSVAVAVALLHFVLAAVSTVSTATDLLLFWGVKGLVFADAGGFDLAFLAWPYAGHTHPNYPPLYPVVLAWSILVSGELPWRFVPLASTFYLVAAIPLVWHAVSRRLGADPALAVTGFWTVAMCTVLVHSHSAGNAEAALLLFEAVAVALVLAEGRVPDRVLRWAVGAALAGAVLTKSEGAVAAGLLVAGVLLRDVWRRDLRVHHLVPVAAPPLAAGGLWFGYRLLHGLPLTDPIREPALAIGFDHVGTVVGAMVSGLQSGNRGVVWLLPCAVLLVAGRRRWLEVLPALVLTVGMLVFLFVYYLHARGDPSQLIGWTVTRVSLPALSSLILAAGVAGFPQSSGGERVARDASASA